MELRFTVVIPTYNREQLVVQAVDSALAQTFGGGIEIVVCDDGSTDGTMKALMEYGDKIKVVSTERAGPGGARNAAIAVGRAEYLSFLDSDDLWHPRTLELVNATIETSGARIVFIAPVIFSDGSRYVWADTDEGRGLDSVRIHVYKDLSCINDAIVPPQVEATCTVAALHRADFDRVGGFVAGQINAEDIDLFLKLLDVGPVAFIQIPCLLAYRGHGAQTNKLNAKNLQGCRLLLANRRSYPSGCGLRTRDEIVYARLWHILRSCIRNEPFSVAPMLMLARLSPRLAWHRFLSRVSRSNANVNVTNVRLI